MIKLFGALCSAFIIVVGKSIIEAVTGHVVFEGFHFGALGCPVAVCHAGGILGGLGAWLIYKAVIRT
jgi:hypothetical protein